MSDDGPFYVSSEAFRGSKQLRPIGPVRNCLSAKSRNVLGEFLYVYIYYGLFQPEHCYTVYGIISLYRRC